MEPVTIILIAAFIGVIALVVGVGIIFQGRTDTSVEARLSAFTGQAGPTRKEITDSLVRDGMESANGFVTGIVKRFERLPMFFRQADCPLRFEQFLMLCGGMAALGAMLTMISRAPGPMIPVGAIFGFSSPWMWLLLRRRSRFNRFEKQLPDALELMGRALRSGHSLSSGLSVVASEMPAPISTEFRTVYEEQNMGISIDMALKNMLERVPNVDLKFFVTAVAIQRQAGGDLAEILAKISHLVRERFKILGQVKALTGEGRISGVVLMGLPVVLFFTVYYINPEYVMVLFNHPTGQKMMYVAIFLQILGAITIKKIVDIKV
jgi:tight adherence protein B